MTAGRGYIALAALIFAKWRPWHALSATILFGYLQAIALRPDLIEAAFNFRVQVQLLDALPDAAAVLTLLHWAALHDWGHPMGAIVHFAPLAALEAYRLWYWYLRPRPVARP